MTATARVSSPKTRKAHTTGIVQAPTIFVYNGTDEDKLISQRAQRLASIFGLSHVRAKMIADLAWGGVVHG